MENTLVVCVVLLVIALAGRLVAYLRDAAQGIVSSEIIFTMVLYRIPGILEVILPISLFLGILLGYGRLYMDSELTVLEVSGFSKVRFTGITLCMGLAVSAAVCVLSIFISPYCQQRVEEIWRAQKNRTEFDFLIPGRFQMLSRGQRTTYVESAQSSSMLGVFMYERLSGTHDRSLVTLAEQGNSSKVNGNEGRFLVLSDGGRYLGVAGDAGYAVVRFEEMGQRIEPSLSERVPRLSALSTGDLLMSRLPNRRAEFLWRISLPWMVLVVSLIAVPLSRVDARLGRYFFLLPGLALILAYLMLLSTAKALVARGENTGQEVFFAVHMGFLLLAAVLFRLRGRT